MTRTLAVVIPILAACGGSASSTPAPEPPQARVGSRAADRATVPLHVEGNRPFVDIALRRADGTTRNARFLVDSGGGGFLLTDQLARDLGLARGETMHEGDTALARVTSPVVASIGDLPLELTPDRVLVMVGKDDVLPAAAPGHADGVLPGHVLARYHVPGHADGVLPGHVLARYHVVFDYPGATFSIARAGALAPRGTPLPMPVSPGSGFPRTELVVDGATHGFLLDTGASFTMVSQALLERWGKAHSSWERHAGAFGGAATLGGQTLETMFVPDATWGGQALSRVGVTSQHVGVFEKWLSSMMTAPIEGSLAGNVLSQFRVDLDSPDQKLYLSRP